MNRHISSSGWRLAIAASLLAFGLLAVAATATASHAKPFIDGILNNGFGAVIVSEDGSPVEGREFPFPVFYLSAAEDRALHDHGLPEAVDDVVLNARDFDPAAIEQDEQLAHMLGYHTLPPSPVEGDYHTTRPFYNGGIYIWTFAASDSEHYPNDRGVNFDAANAAKMTFSNKFGGTWYAYGVYTNCWDASGKGTDVGTLLDDFRADILANQASCPYGTSTWPEDVLIGWVKKATNNGAAYRDAWNGPFSIGAETAAPWKVDWAHSAIAGHEISHLFSAAHDTCATSSIMSYCYAGSLWEGQLWVWDTDNTNIVHNNVWKCLCKGSWHSDSDHPQV